jgi:hypothetical protein
VKRRRRPPAGGHRTRQGLGRGVGHPDRAGLLLAPGSQHKPAPYRTETVNGKLGFVSDFDTETMGLQRYSGGLGEPVPFNYNTLARSIARKNAREF